tara:strand:- start:1574 stop:2038 length:465 start_codon:yes stop_codon:yes gene_type:complete
MVKSKFNRKRIVIQDGQGLTIKVYGGCIKEEKFSFEEIYDFVHYRHILKETIPATIKYHEDELRGYKIIRGKEIIKLDKNALEVTTYNKSFASQESSYRRGYVHGYSTAINHTSVHPLKSVLKYFNDKLRAWRYSNNNDMVIPPSIKRRRVNEK